MNFKFDQDSPLYQQIANQLAEMIFTGVYQAGDQVPSTTQLSASLNINPATVLKGMNQLVALGLLEKRRGGGCLSPRAPRNNWPPSTAMTSTAITWWRWSPKPRSWASKKSTYRN